MWKHNVQKWIHIITFYWVCEILIKISHCVVAFPIFGNDVTSTQWELKSFMPDFGAF